MQRFNVPLVQTNDLPALCGAEKCLADREPGEQFCAKHVEERVQIRQLFKKGREQAEHDSRCIVYFIRQGDSGPVKIGMTQQWSKRQAAIRMYSPNPVTVLALVKCKDRDEMLRLEKSLHNLLADDRTQGEWFRPSRRLNKTLALAKKGDVRGLFRMRVEAIDTA